MSLIECVPNVSEGQRTGVVMALAKVIHDAGVQLLDFSSDPTHNRSVFTFVGDAPSLERAVVALFERAVREIDLRLHRGEHPRAGAVDVVPFVPFATTTMAECVTLARRVGAVIADRFGIPIYLYEAAATMPTRKNLEDVRRGQFEGLSAKMALAEWAPDFGPLTPHPTAGVSILGARGPLIAYNINLATDRLEVAKTIAAAIRQSSGGLPSVKALGMRMPKRGIVQVSINLTDYRVTSMERVFDVVKQEAEKYGVEILESELVGLVPADALPRDAESRLLFKGSIENHILETRMRESGPRSG